MGAHKHWWIIYKEETVEHDTSKKCRSLECDEENEDDFYTSICVGPSCVPFFSRKRGIKSGMSDICPKCLWFVSWYDYSQAFLTEDPIVIEDRHKVVLRDRRYVSRSWDTSHFKLGNNIPRTRAHRYSQDGQSVSYSNLKNAEYAMDVIKRLDGPYRSSDKEDLKQSEMVFQWIRDAFEEAQEKGREAVILERKEI